MIADTERLIDGFRGLPAGMDGSKEPPQTPSEAAWYATNVTFRGGNGPRTRPGFREIPPTYWRNPQPIRPCTITISAGIATVTSAGHGYEDKDKVTISGATPSGVNGTFAITKTGTDTFTFSTSASGTVTGTITARRDVDYSYNQDFINSTTSRTRYATDILGGTYMQGVYLYQDPREGNPTQMIVVVDGKIMALNFNDASCYRLNLSDEISADVPVYMTQAEKFLIIQTGQDEPRVYDGYVLRRASFYGSQVVPIGKQMAYGQGRLFVAINEGAEIIAGDLVFGGSTTNVGVTISSAANPTVITTAQNHGFAVGDQITISGHSSTPPINSTYTIGTIPAANTFTVPVAVTSSGSGGFVSRFNAGQDSDLLRFTENTFLNEGGSFAPSGKVGRVTGMAFIPVQDTATGQGDLIAFCERGAVTFAVSAPRDQWKNTQGFQRVLFDNIGATSDSILPVNGDLFFRSREGNGLRTYRNARAESESYGQTPISAEIDPILKQDTQWMLGDVSLVNFENRLLMTCLPRRFPRRASDQAQADSFAAQPVPTVYEGIAVIDFQSVSTGRGKSAAVFDGVWTGLRILKLVRGTFDDEPRCMALCFHEDATGRRIEIWEITKDDEFDTPVEGRRRIESGIITRAFDFEDSMGLKKLIRCDLWFNDLGGGEEFPFECELAYRPDDYPNFTAWQKFERAFKTEFNFTAPTRLLSFGLDDSTNDPSSNTVTPIQTATEAVFSLGRPSETAGFIFNSGSRDFSDISLTNLELAIQRPLGGEPTLFSLEFVDSAYNFYRFSGVAEFGKPVFLEPTLGFTAEDLTDIIGVQFTFDGPGETPNVRLAGLYAWPVRPENDTNQTDLERGYAPQMRSPAPPRTANLATDVPAYLGHDFTLRVNWKGRAHLGRLMLHGHKLVEATGGGTL